MACLKANVKCSCKGARGEFAARGPPPEFRSGRVVFGKIFRRNPHRAAAEALYDAIVYQARTPAFYEQAAVPDTVDGRFEMIALHAFLVMRHLKGEGAAKDLSQRLFDRMFQDMDQSLREIGVGDLSVGKRIKEMAKAFYGRVVAYEVALDGGDESLEEALRRNHYGTLEEVPEVAVQRLATYVRAADADLATQDFAEFEQGRVRFVAFAPV